MAGPQKRDAGAPAPAHEPTAAALEYVVARGRSLQVAGKFVGPGTPVELPDDEVEHLLLAGFIVLASDQEESGQGVSVGGLQIKGGKRPGPTVI